jgi:hypothetical protein
VFRAAVLSIVLIIAAGPSASLFCKAWCDPHAAAASGCQDEGTGGSTRIASFDSCQDPLEGSIALVRQEQRRKAASDDGASVAVAVHRQPGIGAPGLHPATAQGQIPPSLNHPLNIPLRI